MPEPPPEMETITSEQPTVPVEPSQPQPEPVVPRRSPLRAAIKTGRPKEWIKNVFVFAGLLFSGKFTHHGNDVFEAVVTFVAFCLISSAGYFVNDLIDVELDRKHPKKR
ncbi:MAG: decaprenyl-phosphate phosphoribosyltransferase, partial [Solirubrobacterales bacterium]